MTLTNRRPTLSSLRAAFFRPAVEFLESRLTPSIANLHTPLLAYNAATQSLDITLAQAASTVELAQGAVGGISLSINGQLQSNTSSNGSLAAALAGVRTPDVRQINLIGGGSGDSLIVNGWNSSGNLILRSDGSLTLEGALHVLGTFEVWADSITVSGVVQANRVELSSAGLVNIDSSGSLLAGSGSIQVTANYFVNVGQVHADGVQGGNISIISGSVLSGGSLTATGSSGPGGHIAISFSQSYIDTAAASIVASGVLGGGQVSLSGGSKGSLFSSGRFEADGSTGGAIDLFGSELSLVGAQVVASGSVGAGGQIRIGGDYQGKNANVSNAQTVNVAGDSAIQSNGATTGGRIIVWSDAQTQFAGNISARASTSGSGFIEVSSHGSLNYQGAADAGSGGTLLLDPKNLVVDAKTGVFPQYGLIDPAMGLSGFLVTQVLSNGNIVVDEQYANQSVGAVYLFNGHSGALISVLTGTSTAQIGHTDIVELSNGNYLLSSLDWNNGIGAVTWASASTGVSGVISASNSLVGSSPGDIGMFGSNAAIGLPNGNYVVASPGWNNNLGAVTWGNGSKGVTGVISTTNSLVGATPGTIDANDALTGGDQIGSNITVLTNGNFVVGSANWNNQVGAVTLINGLTGMIGVVAPTNSLVGTAASDGFGAQITALAGGNFVVSSSALGGAVTWIDGTKGATGAISAGDSLVGVGSATVQPLRNGNFLVENSAWNNDRGFVSWGDGDHGLIGIVSESNSLVGSTPASPEMPGNSGDRVGSAIDLTNGNYVVVSPHWNSDIGAVTWGDGTKGVVGVISASNSLVGSQPGDIVAGGAPNVEGGVVALSNGNYVVASPLWNQASGAVTWGDGAQGTSGAVSAENSIVGDPSDFVGGYSNTQGASIIPLTNGNYVIASPYWQNWQGAITWANGSGASSEVVSEANSLVGTLAGSVYNPPSGSFFAGGDFLGNGGGGAGVTALANGNYVVTSPQWNMGRGAATWGDGSQGTSGQLSADNSLIGTTPWTLTTVFAFSGGDRVGVGGAISLTNGNYVISSPQWNKGAGSASWGNGGTGQDGIVSSSNSLVGARTGVLDATGLSYTNGDAIGNTTPTGQGTTGVLALQDGNYFITTLEWNTWGNGSSGISGIVSSANSIAPAPNSYFLGSEELPDGNLYLFCIFGPNSTLPYPGNATTWRAGSNGATLSDENFISARNTVNTATGLVVNGPGDGSFITNLHTLLFINFTDANQLNFALAQGQTITVTPDFITRTLNTGTSVVLQASNDITINSPILETPIGSPGNLTLTAGRSLLLNAAIDTAGGNLTVIANAAKAEGVVDSDRDPGDANITMTGGASLNSGLGTLSIDIENGADKLNHGVGEITLLGLTSSATTIATGNAISFTINGVNPGDGSVEGNYSQIDITGSLSLSGQKLALVQNTATPTGSTFTLIHTTSGVSGTFQGLPEGSTVTLANTVQYRISYKGNGGKDIVLTQLTDAPHLVVIYPLSTSLLVGDQFTLTVQLQDDSGQVLSNYTGAATITQTSGPAAGLGLGLPTVNITNGVAVFQGLTVLQAGNYLLTISSNGVKAAVIAINSISTAPQRYVAAVYQDILGRKPDAAGLDYWVGQLDGGADRTSVAQQLTTSAEYYATVIEPLYKQYLGRTADNSGLAYWTSQMQQGMTDEDLEAQFIASSEFYGHAGGTNKNWVDAMYQNLLGRQPDPAGESYWTDQLAHGANRFEVAHGFAASSEREGQIIQADYMKYLDRTAAPDDISYWLSYFAKGGTDEQIIANFTVSDEYFMGHT